MPQRSNRPTFYRRYGKRLLDLTLALPLFFLLSPLLLLLWLLVRIRLGSPALFRQERPGYNEEPFTILKYRTMTNARDAEGNLLPDGERLTSFGRFLRSTSLDELPELVNVLKGEMSLVGPRPWLVEYLPHYTSEQKRRHEIRPGVTGYAQIQGRQTVLFSRRLEMDIWYVDNLSFSLDLRILLKTFIRVLNSQGVVLDQDFEQIDDLGLSQGLFERGNAQQEKDNAS